jgi:ectoine hydroxylase-related dioxygenase (phytanoyl-CoA dioxygenase family)
MMAVLTREEIDRFWRDGYLTVPNAVTPENLAALKRDFAAWVGESRAETGPYGDCIDGRPRFDLQPGHAATRPALRAVQAQTEFSDAYFEAMARSRMASMVADLIGPDVELHHTKINSKLPCGATEVKWHQDFCFTPHSNSDVVTALLMVDDVTPDNGPLEVAAGSHKGDLHPIWQDGIFTDAIDDDNAAAMQVRAETCLGPAGSVCLMHTRLAHGSAPNRSASPPHPFHLCLFSRRRRAPDAKSRADHPSGPVRGGEDRGVIRSEPCEMLRPQYPKTSFFAQQSAAERAAR